MTKEELKKEAEEWLCNNLHSASEEDFIKAMVDIAEPREKQIQIDAEQIRALQKQNGELTDELTKKSDTNHQLVEQMAELNERNAELKCECRRCVYTDSPCILSDYGKDKNGICDHFKDVFDENAELKKKNLDTQDAVTMQMYTNKANKEIADKQLTKAKELLKRFIETSNPIYFEEDRQKVKAEAEQFLNSEVEK